MYWEVSKIVLDIQCLSGILKSVTCVFGKKKEKTK